MKKSILSKKILSMLLLCSFVFLTSFITKTESPVSISIQAAVTNNVNTGSFTSSGLSTSDGDFYEEYVFNGKKTHSEVTFTFEHGTITAKTHCDITLTSISTATGTGNWIITKGTGDYEGIKGSGTVTLEVQEIGTTNENISQSWTGSIR
jgi:hypothetical protein